MSDFTTRLQAVCVSHLYLNLRHAATIPDPAQTTTALNQDDYFSRVVGSLDGSLVFASDDDDDGDTETDSTPSVDNFSHDVRTGHLEMLDQRNLRPSSDSRSRGVL